jgi:hydroxyacylglutathione hydrolase
MFIQAFPSGPFSTNAYVVACAHTREAAIIDPAPDSSAAIQVFLASQGLKCQKILLTHSHWDHIADVKVLKEKYAIPVYVHPLDAPNLEKPGADQLPCWLALVGVKPDGLLEEGMQIPVGQLCFHVLHTPGHSPGCVCFYEPHQQVLLSGDTLFKGTIGNLSFPTSQPTLMWPSLAKLARLPSETRVFPGHGPETTIQAESGWLCDAESVFG